MRRSVHIDGYPQRLGGHCGSGALRDLLTWAGLDWGRPLSEGLVFGLGGSLAFTYLRVPGLTPPVYLVGRDAELEANVCARLGVETSRNQTDDPAVAWRWLTDELDRGRPVMMNADIAFLPYLRVQLSNTRHDIVAIGYDETAGTVTVADNDRIEPQVVPVEDLDRARSSTGFPDPVRYATWPMRFPNELPDLATAATSAAAAAARRLREGAGQLFDPIALPPRTVTGTGLKGLETFAADLGSWASVMDEEALSQSRRALAVFIEKAGTGGGLFRRLQAEFCTDLADRLESAPFAEAGQAWETAARAWSSLATACVEESSSLRELEDTVREITYLERVACAALELAARTTPAGHRAEG
ncbi:MAG: BtrH N-terminal domain-containing protein [Actinomycetota bacterium]